jgi:hypothetical protein
LLTPGFSSVVEHDVAAGVGDGTLDSLGVAPGLEKEERPWAREALAHLLGGLLQVEDARGRLDDVRLRHDERVAEAGVEPPSQVAGELEVLRWSSPTGTRSAW